MQADCDWTAVHEAIVPARLDESHWTEGDGLLLAALCRHRGLPLLVSSSFSFHVFESVYRVHIGVLVCNTQCE